MIKVDTLIMHKKGVIRFDPAKYAMLEARVAIIGDDCVISAKGFNGKRGAGLDPGEDGENGGNISVILNFEKLERLTLDISGGDRGQGANGENGRKGTYDRTETLNYKDSSGKAQSVIVTLPGEPGSYGTDATMGGNPGSGGNLLFMFSTNGFIPTFNNEKWSNSIIVKHQAGQRGKDGLPGRGGLNARSGTLQKVSVTYGREGKIQLMNLSTKAYKT